MKIVFLFGGQGSQLPGMALDVRQEFSQTEQLFQTAFSVNPDLEQVLHSESEDINQTGFTQTAIALFGAAIIQVLQENGIAADAAIGSSIGEYPALAGLGVWSLTDMIKIASARGSLMAERLSKRKAEGFSDGMHAVLGLTETIISPLLEKYDQLWITNINDEKQVVISGQIEQLVELESELKQAGARRIVPLAVEGAFHTPIFAAEQKELLQIIEQYPLSVPQKEFYFNRNAEPLSAIAISEDQQKKNIQLWMSEQMISPVRFYQCGEKLFADQTKAEIAADETNGATDQAESSEQFDLAVEISAKPVIAGMLRKYLKNIPTVQINSAEQLKEFLQTI
ncbi:MAG: ACP S-malonyltransferase [Saccharofermentanales bacterium]|jgi:[acyl-carrier-protein] S-malonyltransferase